ncbi:hypothetical protein PACTADRAFT_49368 [Pachysolen tannophilus NRRL Y-2460]|uniref:Uncharacterized protein n=1 Tax=Pachysolen tannophilus NRRL Y-2460 TaxID=669874 RepID=A0A1E4TW26_PACTA|nr:hypothetical protein PACTADRAFT_49368 [Pachysolen tannophilus NRRL Y-2460]
MCYKIEINSKLNIIRSIEFWVFLNRKSSVANLIKNRKNIDYTVYKKDNVMF